MRAVKEVQQRIGGPGARVEAPTGTVEKVRNYPSRMQQFFHDVRLEMRNVTWPTWKDVQATTVVVLVATFFFGFYLGAALDIPIARLMSWLLQMGRQLGG